MVGRGAVGRPWLLAEIAAEIYGAPRPVKPRGQALADLMVEHLDSQLAFYGAGIGIRAMRKHFDAYLADLIQERSEISDLRNRLMRSDCHRAAAAMIRAEVPVLDTERLAA